MSQVNHTPYRDLHLLPIAGAWREGSAPQSLQVSDPYNGETLLQIKQATRDDLDEAYQAAARPGRVGDDRTGAALCHPAPCGADLR